MKTIILSITFSALFTITVNAQSNAPVPENHKKAQTYAAKSVQTPPAPIITKLTNTKKPDNTKDSGNQQNPNRNLELIGLLQAAIFVFQLIVFGMQAKRLKETVEATKALTLSAEKTARIHERAYVYEIGEFRYFDHRTETFIPSQTFFSAVINYGKTPAFINGICIEICGADGLPKVPDYHGQEFYGTYLAPGIRETTERDTKRIYKGLKNPIVYGRVWYTDIFGDKHSSGFFYAVVPDGKAIAIKPPSAEFTNCD